MNKMTLNTSVDELKNFVVKLESEYKKIERKDKLKNIAKKRNKKKK